MCRTDFDVIIVLTDGVDNLSRMSPLTAAEIVGEVLVLQAGLAAGERISNIVLMGMGEPLANYDNTLRAIHLIHHPDAFKFSSRRITLSGELNTRYTLCISATVGISTSGGNTTHLDAIGSYLSPAYRGSSKTTGWQPRTTTRWSP
jgi:23S rRNA (adenine2503-C2)-methyltransferase